MGNDAKRTPPPYYIVHNERDCVFYICRRWDDEVRVADHPTFGSCYGAHIADISYCSGVPTLEQARANARHIVQACNAHDALLFAAEQALMAISEGYDAPKIRDDLRAAIALATEAADE